MDESKKQIGDFVLLEWDNKLQRWVLNVLDSDLYPMDLRDSNAQKSYTIRKTKNNAIIMN